MGNDIYAGSKGRNVDSIFDRGTELTKELITSEKKNRNTKLGEVLFITSYPPRECGIANYSKNLITALNQRFENFFDIRVCALETDKSRYYYPAEVSLTLNTADPSEYDDVAGKINHDSDLNAVVIQHEFGLFPTEDQNFILFLKKLKKPVIIAFHTVTENPSDFQQLHIREIESAASRIIVMAGVSREILIQEYKLPKDKIEVIPYGTPMVTPARASILKEKYKLQGKFVLSTIGLISPGKGIENTLEALPAVIKAHPEVMFLVIGKTHPEHLKKEGENYRVMLESRVKSLKLQNHVQFLNVFLNNEMLTEYFQLSDICIFSCKDTSRPVSATMALAASCGCPVISTATQHAHELLDNGTGIIYDHTNHENLSDNIIQLIDNPALRKRLGNNILKKSHASSWENSALTHGILLNTFLGNKKSLEFRYPPINLDFVKSLTDRTGIIHTTFKGEADLRSGYQLDDNAFALFIFCMHFKITGDQDDIPFIKKYLKFIYHCYQPSGIFLKYLDYERKFTAENYTEEIEETQAKAILALGYLYSMKGLLASDITDISGLILESALPAVLNFKSGKSIAFAVKGLYYYYSVNESKETRLQIKTLADNLVAMYRKNSSGEWRWFEEKFSGCASTLPEALLNTWLITGDHLYKDLAIETYEFLASKTFDKSTVNIKSAKDWLFSAPGSGYPAEKPSDIAFNVIALSKFYLMCKDNEYFYRMDSAFKWFLGNNRLKQMIYNPANGGSFDGLDETGVDLHQSAESALSFLLARMVVEKYKFKGENHINQLV